MSHTASAIGFTTKVKLLAAIIIAIAVVFVLILVIPMPSFHRSATFTNQLSTTIELQCSTADGRYKKKIQIPPNGKKEFVYFSGDHDGRQTVTVVVNAKNIIDGMSARREFSFPLATNPPEIRLSSDWFSKP